MKNQKLKALVVGGIAATAMAMSGQAAAVWDNSATGPVWINGYISVDNTGEPGGIFNDFACKIKGHGMAIPGTNTIRIDGIQALNRSSGQAPRGCHFVQMRNLPWLVTVNASPAPSGTGISSTTNVSFTGVEFQAVLPTPPPQPGCGDGDGTVTGGVTWTQMRHQIDMSDAAYSTLTFNSAPLLSDDGECLITGVLKFTRPLAPVRD